MGNISIGFTGTQRGMTAQQRAVLRSNLAIVARRGELWFHHGLCIGSDEQAHRLAVEAGVNIVGHPPDNGSKVMDLDADTILEFCVLFAEEPYLERNKAIVESSSLLWATPATFTEVQRSGTWATIRYARKIGRDVRIIWPDGSYS